ncbi:MAG: hypothetical protein HLUCCA08_07240 [Rhodobacteraceae bacterium HLUCCA08]|nr:MAG: hypothetical protein HLUCCA08_07240 [Rhodobacteraceae bacterium HLUCCA08]
MTRLAVLSVAALLALHPVSAAAQEAVVTRPASGAVPETVAALSAAIEAAGATVFAVIDHGGGARQIGEDVGDMQLVIFGNPAIGTPAILDDPLAGLHLPLRVLVYEDAEGAVRMAWEGPADMLSGLQIPSDAAYLGRMAGALDTLTEAAQ